MRPLYQVGKMVTAEEGYLHERERERRKIYKPKKETYCPKRRWGYNNTSNNRSSSDDRIEKMKNSNTQDRVWKWNEEIGAKKIKIENSIFFSFI